MTGEMVTHVKYGAGRVVETDRDRITVAFEGMEDKKRFKYPDAFERFLTFEDPSLQQSARTDVTELKRIRKEEEKQRQEACRLYEARIKQEQSELLKRRRKAARERQTRDRMAKAI